MLHAVDDHAERSAWIGTLARAPLAVLEHWAAARGSLSFTWLRRPETGLVMVRARAGGAGDKFNLGEMAVTRCALRLDAGAVGVAYVRGRSPRRAELAALADALLQTVEAREDVKRTLLEPLRGRLDTEAARARRVAQSTKVEFFALARGGD